MGKTFLIHSVKLEALILCLIVHVVALTTVYSMILECDFNKVEIKTKSKQTEEVTSHTTINT